MSPSFTALPLELQEMIIKLVVDDDLTPKRISRRGFPGTKTPARTVLPLSDSFGSATFQLARTSSVFYTLVEKHIREHFLELSKEFGRDHKLCWYKNERWQHQTCNKHNKRMAQDDIHEHTASMNLNSPLCVPCGLLRARINAVHDLWANVRFWREAAIGVLTRRFDHMR